MNATKNNHATARLIVLVSTILALMLFHQGTARAGIFTATNAQSLQNALTTAASNGAVNVIILASNYYGGNFNYNSGQANSLTLTNAPGVTNSGIIINGAGTSMSLSSTGNADIAVYGITFARNGYAGLHISTLADIQVQNCLFLAASNNNSSGLGLEIVSGQNATIENCIANGLGRTGSALSVSGLSGNVTIANCILSSNVASLCLVEYNNNCYYGGAAVYVSIPGTLTLVGNSMAYDNGSPGGWPAGAGADCSAGSVVMVSNTFTFCNGGGGFVAWITGNSVTLSNNTLSANLGSAIYINGQYVITGNTISANIDLGLEADTSGEGIISGNTFANNGGGVSASARRLQLFNNSFYENAGGNGGAVFCGNPATNLIYNNTFFGNSASGNGGAVYCVMYPPSIAVISNNIFTANTSFSGAASGNGGGAVFFAGGGGPSSIINNSFSGNSASAYGGGINAVFANYNGSASNPLLLSGNTFEDCVAGQQAGAVYASGPYLTVQDNLFAHNSSGSDGGALWLNPTAELNMINNTVTANTNSGNGGGAAFQINGSVELLNVFNNIIWGNSSTGHGADVFLAGIGKFKQYRYNDTDDMAGVWDLATNNLDVDPQFFDPINGDYHLRQTSGCVAIGDTNAPSLPATDLSGNPRIVNGTVDLGCYEFNNSAYHPADTNDSWTITSAEFNAYGNAWLYSEPWTTGPNPISADFVTRAGYLLENGGSYLNDGSAQPTNWKPVSH